ncbi:cytidine deaminase [Paracoccaceae bacterium]|nr:cytidine deaminase [Paracoccaceae bacterium]
MQDNFVEVKMDLIKKAIEVRKNAYAPYSNFLVGAAIKAKNGSVFSGCNVENAAYPEGTCAEAGAIAAMIASGQREIIEVVVAADSQTPVTPCGGCRQKLAEFSNSNVIVIFSNLNGEVGRMTLEQLLPGAFEKEQMRS